MVRLVFDLDGTLIDSAPDLRALANTLLRREHRKPITLAETRSFIGNGTRLFIARMRAAREIPDSEQDRLHEAFLEGYQSAVRLTRPYPGVTAVLGALRDNGHRLGICTNKPKRATDSVLSHLGMNDRFSAVLGGDSLPIRKPDPAPLYACLDALGDGPGLYIGDSEVDAETARRAEVPFLLFTEGYRKSPVDHIPHSYAFSDFSALPGLIRDCMAATN